MRNSYEEDIRRWRRKAEEALEKANVPPPYIAVMAPDGK